MTRSRSSSDLSDSSTDSLDSYIAPSAVSYDPDDSDSSDLDEKDEIHKRYNCPDADVVLLSVDDVKFRVHSVLLKACSTVLADKLTDRKHTVADSDTDSDLIQLTAHSKTLALLLDFIYPTSGLTLPQPATLEKAAILADFANELGINHVLAYLRAVILAEEKYHASPVDLYALACKWEWEDVQDLASKETLKLDMSSEKVELKLWLLEESDRLILETLHDRRMRKIYQCLFPCKGVKTPEGVKLMSHIAKCHCIKEAIEEDGDYKPKDEQIKDRARKFLHHLQKLENDVKCTLQCRPLGDTLLLNICSTESFACARKAVCPACGIKYLDFYKLISSLRQSVSCESTPRTIADITKPVKIEPVVDPKTSNKRKRCHERYNDPDADLVIRTTEDNEFRVNSFFLKTSSQVFGDMFQVADQGPIPVSEDSEMFALLLDYIHPTNDASIPDIATIKKAAALVEVAHKYDIPHVMASVRTAVLGWMKLKPIGQSDAEQLYILGCKWRWEDVVVLASESLLLFDTAFWKRLSAGGMSCYRLFALREQRKQRFVQVVTPRFISLPEMDLRGTQCDPAYRYVANCYCVDKMEISGGKENLKGRKKDAYRVLVLTINHLMNITSNSIQIDPLGHNLIRDVLSSGSGPFVDARMLLCPFCNKKYFNFDYIIETFCNIVDTLADRSIRYVY